jgi:hypothetical protein
VTTTALTNGLHAVTARATNAIGTGPLSSALSVRIDTLAPTTATLALAYPLVQLAGTATTTTLPARVSWSATDAGSGITSYQLQRATGAAGAFANQTLAAPTSTALTQQLAQGSLFRYRVRATDLAGNVAAFSAIVSRTLASVQETAAAVAYGGTWASGAVTGASGGNVRFSGTAGATATYTFSGNTVAWVSTRGANRGIAQVRLDGVLVATVNLFSATSTPRTIVYATSGLAAGTHTLQVRATGTHGAGSTGNRVDIDAFLRMH